MTTSATCCSATPSCSARGRSRPTYPTRGETVFLDSFVLVASWTGADGEGWLTRIPSRNLRSHTRAGLLHEALYGFEGD